MTERDYIPLNLYFFHDFYEGFTYPANQDRVILERETFEELVSGCREFYSRISDQEIEDWNNKILERLASISPTRSDLSGYVYLAKSETGHYKIGVSKTPKKRIKVFDTKMPIKVELIHSFPCDDAHEAERVLHEMYSDKHHEGEWFNLTFVDVDLITEITSYENGTFEVDDG